MSLSQEQEKVLLRIKKMLALANDSAASEGERDNALRMAHKLLAIHNLAMSEVENVGIERLSDSLYLKPKWTRRVCHGISILFFTKYYFENHSEHGNRHVFIGTRANVETSMAMAAYVCDSIMREIKARAQASKIDDILGLGAMTIDADYRNSFADGAAIAVGKKCRELKEQAEKEQTNHVPGTGLVLASYYRRELIANDQWLKDRGINLRSSRSTIRQGAGFAAGTAFGKSINLSRQVSASPSAKQLR